MNSPLQILDKKDQNFPSSNAGKRTIEWAKENNFKIKNREDIWRAYMARAESIFTKNSKNENDIQNSVLANNEGKVEGRKETKSERAIRFMKYKIQKENTIDLKNSDEVNKIATGLYESEKKIAIERGMGGDIENLDDGQVISRYIESIKEKKEIISKINLFCKDNLKLNIHKVEMKTVYSGVDFLGWVHFPKYRILRKVTKLKMFRNINEDNLKSYRGLLKWGNTYGIAKECDL